MKKKKLIQELHTTGSNKSEARELAQFAAELSSAAPSGLLRSSKKRIAEEIGIKKVHHIPRYALAGAGGFAVLAVFFAQSALPGSFLYPVKRGTEQVRTVVQPSYTENLVDERREEVELLKQESASEETVEKAEKEYRKTREKADEKNQEKQQDRESGRDDGGRVRGAWDDRNDNNDSDDNDESRDRNGFGGFRGRR